MNRRPGLLVLALSAALSALILSACSGETTDPKARAPIPVTMAEVAHHEFLTSIESLGTTRALESVEITAQVTDVVRELGFVDGQAVEMGHILVRLGGGEEPAKMQEARVNLEKQRRELKRIEGLVQQKLLPAQSLDTQRSLVSEAEAQLEGARARVGERVIRAPFGGVLGLRRVSPGALVTPGTVITTLDDVSVMRLDFSIPETFLAGLSLGQEIVAKSRAYPERDLRGRVVQIDSRVDPVTRAVIVRAELPNPEGLLRPGMLLTLRLIKDRRQSLAVPEASLLPVRDEQYVLVIGDDDKVERRRIEIGRRAPGRVEVLSGLSEGERVVVEGTVRVRPGGKVRVLDAQAGAE